MAAIPPRHPEDPRARWATTGAAIVASAGGGGLDAAVGYVAAIASAFAGGQPERFNAAVSRYRQWLVANGMAPDVRRAAAEVFYNGLQPVSRAVAVYAVGLILLCVAWATGWIAPYRSAVLLVLLAFGLHTVGLAFAVMLAGRPSLLVSACWGIALAAIGAEWFWRRGVGVAAAAAVAAAALVTSSGLAPGGTRVLLQAVFDVNLLAAVVVTALALAVAGASARSLAWKPLVSRYHHHSCSRHFGGRRSLRTE